MVKMGHLLKYIEEAVSNNSHPLLPTNYRPMIDTILVNPISSKTRAQPHSRILIPEVNCSFASSSIQPIDGVITFSGSPISRGGNRAGRANSGSGQNWAGPKLARFFRAKILTAQPALKTGSSGPNSIFKAKKNSGGPGRAIPGWAKFGPIFFGPII